MYPPFPPVPRRALARVSPPPRGRHDYTGGRPDPDEDRARVWTILAWRACEGGSVMLCRRFAGYAYALGSDEMKLGIIVNMVRAAVAGMEPNEIGRMVEAQVKRQGGDPRTFWNVVKETAEARLAAWDRWEARKAREAAAEGAVDAEASEVKP